MKFIDYPCDANEKQWDKWYYWEDAGTSIGCSAVFDMADIAVDNL
jgi:hypothetical protein